MKYVLKGLLLGVIGLPSAALAQVHEGDVVLTVTEAAITTDRCVYGAELGENIPDETNNPGFDSLAAMFSVPSSIGFRILDALRVWDGSDFDAVAGPTMTLSFSSLNRTTPITPDTVVQGFTLPVQSNGQWHRHLVFTPNSPATDGVYLLSFQLFSTDPLLDDSLPFWFVFKQNVDEATHTAAIEWAQANLAIEPPTLGDTDGDGDVDVDDLTNVKSYFGQPGPASPGDADGDDDTDVHDFIAVKNNFDLTPPGITFVPEPASLILLAGAGPLLFKRSRRSENAYRLWAD